MKDSKKTSTLFETANRPAIVAIAVLVLLAIAFVILFSTGFLKAGKGVVSTNSGGLCESVISDYNSAFKQTSAEGHASKLASSAKAAAEISDNQTDPNCVFIQFSNAMYVKNVDDTAKFANTLKSLANEDKYITGQLYNPLGIDAIERNAEILSNPDSNSNIQGNG